jgi:hypothetical protein
MHPRLETRKKFIALAKAQGTLLADFDWLILGPGRFRSIHGPFFKFGHHYQGVKERTSTIEFRKF